MLEVSWDRGLLCKCTAVISLEGCCGVGACYLYMLVSSFCCVFLSYLMSSIGVFVLGHLYPSTICWSLMWM